MKLLLNFSINSEQNWIDGSYYPVLPKFGQSGNFLDVELDEDGCPIDLFDHVITEAEYQGKKVKLNDPIRTSENPNKKFKVYVKDGDKIKVVRFGDPNMSIKRDDPERRKNFRA